MRPPVPISTLPDAAKWMSELSGAPMSEREVLGHAFNFQWAAEHAQRAGEPREEEMDGDAAAPGEPPAMFTTERIIQVLIPSDVDLRLRQWRLDGYTDRPATGAQRAIALDSYELFELLTCDRAEVSLPRYTDPVDGDEYAELMLDGAVVTHAMTRIYARGLYILAAWWQSTVGAASRHAPSVNAAPASRLEGRELPPPRAAPPRAARKQPPINGDALTTLVWSICYDMLDSGERPKPGSVMAELKRRADKDGRREYPLLSSVAGGIKWEDSSGNEHELNVPALGERLTTWRKANDNA